MGFYVENAPARAMRKIGKMLGVMMVEVDTVVEMQQGECVSQSIEEPQANWGQQRGAVAQAPEANLGSYKYDALSGNGTIIYMLDTGADLQGNKEEFGISDDGNDDRIEYAKPEESFCNPPCSEGSDGNGHGTHLTGIALSKTFGVAKNAKGLILQVLNNDGKGKLSKVIEGLMWSMEHHSNINRPPAIINLSLGGPLFSFVANEAITMATKQNIAVVVAAGNQGRSSCFNVPANIPHAIAVGCSDRADRWCHFSNNGPCVDIVAPGRAIRSIQIGGETQVLSGTSMSAPFVSGAIARYRSHHPTANVEEIREWLKSRSLKGVLQDIPMLTTDHLLHIPCDI